MSSESRKRLWPDDETWLGFFHEAFCEDPELAEQLARIWYVLLRYLADGPEGVRRARQPLRQALRLVYPFTSSYRRAHRYFKLSLSGQVKADDEPRKLLRDSIERARVNRSEPK